MSFVAGFYSLSVELNDVDGNRFAKLRVKTPRHLSETSTHLAARFLAYVHAYSAGLEFSQGLFEPKQPTLWERDIDGSVLRWIYVGLPSTEMIELAFRERTCKDYRVYLYEDKEDQIASIRATVSHPKLKGKRLTLYDLRSELVTKLADLEESSASWKITFIDGHMFLTVRDSELESEIGEIIS